MEVGYDVVSLIEDSGLYLHPLVSKGYQPLVLRRLPLFHATEPPTKGMFGV